MNKNQQIKAARRAFAALEVLNKGCSSDYTDRFLELALEEEKGHRRWGSDFARHHPSAASAIDCARMFCVRRVAEYLNGEPFPVGKAYLHTKKSCFYAAGLVDEFRAQIAQAWAGENVAELATLDLCDHGTGAERGGDSVSAQTWPSETAWMQLGTGWTCTFDYERAGCGSGSARIYKRSKEEAEAAADAHRDQYIRMGFKCSPIVGRVGA